MRWQELFDDLAAQARASEDADLVAEVEERSRDELGRMRLVDRFAGDGRQPVDIELVGGERVRGTLMAVGDGWVSVDGERGDVLVPVWAISRVVRRPVAGNRLFDPLHAPLHARLGLRPVLRELARRRVYVRVLSTAGHELGGTVDRVGADHVELAEHPADRPRRASEVRSVSLVPFAALVRLTSGTS